MSTPPLFPSAAGRRVNVRTGAVHLPGWLDLDAQRRLVRQFRKWAIGPVPIRAAALPGGRRMSVQTVCLGWHWQPYRYTRTANDVNGRPVMPFPDWLGDIGRAAVTAAYGPGPGARYRPDAALVNLYDRHARLGMHQDKRRDRRRTRRVPEHRRQLPVPIRQQRQPQQALYRRRPTLRRRLRLRPRGQVAFHGVPKINPATADPATGLDAGRINITMRATGLGGR